MAIAVSSVIYAGAYAAPLAEPEPKTTSQNTSRYAPMKKLAIVPGRKPRYVEQFNIENYLLDGERAPRWTNGEIPSILSESDVSRYRVIFRVQQEGEIGTSLIKLFARSTTPS